MNFELLKLESATGRLHGMQTGEGPRLSIHLHGTWGNFYQNPFVTALTDTYLQNGWRYASVNLPSHDGGSIGEKLEDSLLAIQNWITHLSSDGDELILQGHSLGALKIIRALHDGLAEELGRRIKAAVLLAPFDIVAFNAGATEEEVQKNRAAVSEILRSDPEAFVPRHVFDHWPLSAATFLDITEAGGRWDVFPSREKSQAQWIAGCAVPTLVAVGASDFAAFPNAREVITSLQDIPHVSAHEIQDAPHNFAGREETLAGHLDSFLSTLR